MPDDNKNLNNGGGQGDAGSGDNGQKKNNDQGGKDGAGAGGGSNDSGGTDNGQGQGGKKDDGAGAGDETITIKKSDWEKTTKDLDTYRSRVVGKKSGEFSLDQNNAGGSDNGAGNGGGAPALDEKKVREIATQASQANTHKANEKTAIKQFLKSHVDYTDEKLWAELLTHLPASINKDDPAAIVDAMEGAVLLHKRASGQLDQYLKDQAEIARQKAEMDANVNLGFGAGGVGQRSNQGNQANKIPESTVEMGKRFGHSSETIEKTLKEVPKGPEGGFQINVMPQKK